MFGESVSPFDGVRTDTEGSGPMEIVTRGSGVNGWPRTGFGGSMKRDGGVGGFEVNKAEVEWWYGGGGGGGGGWGGGDFAGANIAEVEW